MKVYEQIGFENVRWSDNPGNFSQSITIEIPYEDLARRSEDLELIGLQLIFEHKGANEDEPQTDYDKGLQLFADILFDEEKSEQFLKECKAMGIEPQTERSSE